MHEWPINVTNVKYALSTYTNIARTIGVRDLPDLTIWVKILQEIGQTSTQAENVSPNEKDAAEFALEQVVKQLSTLNDNTMAAE